MADDKVFYYQTLMLYIIIDLLIIYLTFSFGKPENRSTLYSVFIFLLGYSIFGLYLLIQDLSIHYSGVSSTSINFANTSGGNMQILSAWGLMLVNIIAIGVYAYSIATGSASSGNAGSGSSTASSKRFNLGPNMTVGNGNQVRMVTSRKLNGK